MCVIQNNQNQLLNAAKSSFERFYETNQFSIEPEVLHCFGPKLDDYRILLFVKTYAIANKQIKHTVQRATQ